MDGFEKWLRNLPIDFIQHMWEFYQEDIDTNSDVAPIAPVLVKGHAIRTYYYKTPEQLEEIKNIVSTPMTEADVFNSSIDLGLSTKEALKILQWRLPTDGKQ